MVSLRKQKKVPGKGTPVLFVFIGGGGVQRSHFEDRTNATESLVRGKLPF